MTKQSKIYMRAPNGEVFQTSNPEWHSECERLTNSEGVRARQQWACTALFVFGLRAVLES